MDHEGKFPLRKGKGLHISLQKGDGGMIGKMRDRSSGTLQDPA